MNPPIVTAERLLSFDDDYEPSGLMTPRDRAELERRRAECQASGEPNRQNSGKERDLEKITAVAKS